MVQLRRITARFSLLLFAAVLASTQLPEVVFSHALTQEANRQPSIELEQGFVWLFDGKSLNGWEGNQDWFRIEEGSIVAGSLAKEIPHNEFLGTTKQYGNFELKLEARLKGTGDNAGVQFRSSRVPDSTEVSGYQCDIGSAWGRPVWGGLYDESRRNKMLAEGDPKVVVGALKAEDWNELMVRAVDSNIQIWLNGSLTIDYTEVDSEIAKRGIIALQIHSGPPTEAWYRNIRIRELPALR